MMTYPLLAVLLTTIITLVVIGFRRPQLLRGVIFPYTRKCLGMAVVSFGISQAALACSPFASDYWFPLAIIAQVAGWFYASSAVRSTLDLFAIVQPDVPKP